MEKVLCPNCHKINEIHKFCIYCGHKLLDDDQIRLSLDKPEAYCLNCGRTVKKCQRSCECGYELGDVSCPECNTKNAYTNRFCISCGKKLWTSDVYDYRYPERLFEEHLFNEKLPFALKNTSLEKRAQKGIGKNLDKYLNYDLAEQLKSVDNNLSEICSRWKVVSPNYCINCLGIISPVQYSCLKCKTHYDEKRVGALKTTGYYTNPGFADNELKWTPKNNGGYMRSLAPAIGESLFEYRERLKWEFEENNRFKVVIKSAIRHRKEEEERKRRGEEIRRQRQEQERREMEYISKYGGGYCGFDCRHFYEEFLDSSGGIVGDFDCNGYVEYNCNLGHTVSTGEFCKDYER